MNTQDNWRKYWKNYETTRNDEIYRNMNHNNNNNHSPIFAIILICIMIFVVIIPITKSIIKFNMTIKTQNEEIQSEKLSQNVSIKQSNRNGKIAGTNLKRINECVVNTTDDLYDISEDKIEKYITEINKMDLSNDYDDYKEQVINKLNAAIKFKKYYNEYKKGTKGYDIDTTNDYLHKFNDIDVHETLKQAFDSAGVEYRVKDNGTINYTIKDY